MLKIKMFIYDMKDKIPTEILDNFCKFITGNHWLQGVPGGFCSNSPKRLVNAFGNGDYDTTHWTGKISYNKVTLHTKPNPLPKCFSDMIPHLNKLFVHSYPDAQLTPGTFSIGVCNFYTDPDMYIAAHTDDNVWYPSECSAGPVFASLTLYPEGEPTNNKFARFQIKEEGEWKQVDLPDKSVMIMPSSIEHRVQKYKKCDYKHFKPRINVTFRSVYPKKVNPLMNAMAISNHARYYCIPVAITFPTNFCESTKQEIITIYKNFASKYGKKIDVHIKDRDRKSMIQKYRSFNFPHFRVTNNMVTELFEIALKN